MQSFVSLSSPAVSSAWTLTANLWPLPHCYGLVVSASTPLQTALPRASNLSLDWFSNLVVALSCIAIAGTLAAFLLSAESLRFRKPVLALTICTGAAGFLSLFLTIFTRTFHPAIAVVVSPVAAVLAVLTACLLPAVLPHLLSARSGLETAAPGSMNNPASRIGAPENAADAFFVLQVLHSTDGQIEDFRFSYLNDTAEKLIGKRRADVLGARLTRILPIVPGGRLFQQYCAVMRNGEPLIHEFPLNQNDHYGLWMRHHVARVESGLAVTASDVTQTMHAKHGLLEQPLHDMLTGLPNRRLLDDRVQQAIARADRYRKCVALYLVNLDGFQKINQQHGRPIGDQVLIAAASRLRASIRSTDTIIRLGGDEFLIVMPDMHLDLDIRRSAATLVALLRDPVNALGQSIEISCSIGVAVYPDTARTVKKLLTAADTALFRAKSLGKNQYILAHSSRTASQPEPGDSPTRTKNISPDS